MYTKKGDILAKCKACGWAGELDNSHKLAAFITKNPPDESGLNIVAPGGDTGKKASKEERRKAKLEKQKGKPEDEEDDDEEEKKEKKDKKEKKEKKDKKEKKEKKKKDKGEDDDDDEAVEKKDKKDKKDKKEKKEKKQKKEKKEKKEKKDNSSDDENGDSDSGKENRKDDENLGWDDDETAAVVSTLSTFVNSKGGKPSVADFFEEVRLQQISKVFDHRMRLSVALEALCGKTVDAKALGEKQKYVEHLSSNANMSTADVLWAFDTYLKVNPGVAKAFPMILKLLYDGDEDEDDED